MRVDRGGKTNPQTEYYKAYYEAKRDHDKRLEEFLRKKVAEGYLLDRMSIQTSIRPNKGSSHIMEMYTLILYKPRLDAQEEYLGSIN